MVELNISHLEKKWEKRIERAENSIRKSTTIWEDLNLNCTYNLKSFRNEPSALLTSFTIHSPPLSLACPCLPLALKPYTFTYVFEFKQNLPGQLDALLIHVFDGNNISLMVGVKGGKGKLTSEGIPGCEEYWRTRGASRSSAGHYEGAEVHGKR